MKYSLFVVSAIAVVFQTACTSKVNFDRKISGHRIVTLPERERSKSPKNEEPASQKAMLPDSRIDVALTNYSLNTLCDVKLRVIGLGKMPANSSANKDATSERIIEYVLPEAWSPGRVWYLGLDEQFECEIPVQVLASYSYLEPRKKNRKVDYFTSVDLERPCDLVAPENLKGFKKKSVRERVSLQRRPTAIRISEFRKCKVDRPINPHVFCGDECAVKGGEHG